MSDQTQYVTIPTTDEPEQDFEVSVTGHFTAATAEEAVEQMIEWLVAHGNAHSGTYTVAAEDGEPVFVDASDL